ncbi:MAG: amidohydrolase [bacterium]|nr:amidohydrolase [bacterium]
MKNVRWLAVPCLAFALAAQEPADTIYYNAKVVTVDDERPLAEAVAVSGDRFLAVGSNEEVLKLAGAGTRKVDLEGKTVMPGMIESHTHPISASLSEKDGPIPVMNSIPEVQAFIRKEAKRLPADKLIFVPKVYSTRLKERRYPTRWEIDEAAPGRRAMTDNNYAAVLNSVLLKELGITRDTPDPANGKIGRDANGEPNGIVLGAGELLGKVRRSRVWTHQDRLWAIRTIQKRFNGAGITSTVDRAERPEGLRAFQELHRNGELTMRVSVTYRISASGTPAEVKQRMEAIPFVTGFGDEWLSVGPIKTVLDGGILIGTAFLRAPWGPNTQIYGYVDPDYRGVQAVSRGNLCAMAHTAAELGWQMTAHTAGGGATDLLLDAYEEVNKTIPLKGRRWQVTHGNFPDPRAIRRAAKMGVIFDSQIAWHHFDGPAIKDVFGPERIRNLVPLRSLIDAGVTVVGGSDHMIRHDSRLSLNPYHPFYGMWMTVTRKTVDGSVLVPEERITRKEALRLWTINGAYGMFEEDQKGSIEPGKLADLIVIDRDYLRCPVDEIKDIEVLLTVVGGKTVFRAANQPSD